MKNNLGTFINSFSLSSRKAVESILHESRLEKQEIGRMIQKITSFSSAGDYLPLVVAPLNEIQRVSLVDYFRDMELRVKSLYNISSTLSTISSSMANIFGGEIKKIEKDIDYLSSYIDHYSFVSGEDDLYNLSFIENFDNDQNYYEYDRKSPITAIPDRSEIPYFLSKEKAHVDNFTGTLKISSELEKSLNPIDQENIELIEYYTNFSKDYISSDTGVSNLLSGAANATWNLTIKSPFILNESIFSNPEFQMYDKGTSNFFGADIAVKVILKKSVYSSRIRISPNIGEGLYLTQMVLFTNYNLSDSNQQQEGIPMMDQPMFSKKNIDVDFPGQEIKAFILFFKQTNYSKTKIPTIQSEINSKLISAISKKMRMERKKDHDILQDYVITFFLRDFTKDYVLRNKNIYSYNYSKYYPVSQSKKNINLLKGIKDNIFPIAQDSVNKFKNADLISHMIYSIVSYSLGSKFRGSINSTYLESNLRDSIKPLGEYFSGGMVPVGDSNLTEKNIHLLKESTGSFQKNDVLTLMNSIEEQNKYEYMFSIKNISLFFNNSNLIEIQSISTIDRSYFVSKKIPLKQKPLSVKMLANYRDSTINLKNLSISESTCVEFSVTTKEDPSKESDWIPILPYNEQAIDCEILFPDANTKRAKLRFVPKEESFQLFEGNIRVPSDEYTISGMYVEYQWIPGLTYLCSYTPSNIDSCREISLFSRNLNYSLVSNYSSNGNNGEKFKSLNSDKTVYLSEKPYINRAKFINATYNQINGVVTSSSSSFGNFDYSSYSPVKVVFDDGTTAVNMTNYLIQDNQPSTFFDREDYCFVHFDQKLIFNKETIQPFTVMYEYIPDIFRYRVVFRSLTETDENSSLDRLIFKFSSEKNDSLETNFVRYDNIFKEKVT